MAKEIGAIFMVDMAHYAGLIGGGPVSQPGAARRRGDQHHAQELAARPRGGIIPMKAEHEKAINSAIFPACRAARWST